MSDHEQMALLILWAGLGPIITFFVGAFVGQWLLRKTLARRP